MIHCSANSGDTMIVLHNQKICRKPCNCQASFTHQNIMSVTHELSAKQACHHHHVVRLQSVYHAISGKGWSLTLNLCTAGISGALRRRSRKHVQRRTKAWLTALHSAGRATESITLSRRGMTCHLHVNLWWTSGTLILQLSLS